MLGPLASLAFIASCSVPRPAKGPEPTLNTGCANHELAHRVFPPGLARRAKPARNTNILTASVLRGARDKYRKRLRVVR
jgi:hypothetical protein